MYNCVTATLYGMYKNKKILAIIPARGGSKRLPGKNIKKILGKPLIGYAIEAIKKSNYVDRIVVSTDDRKIAAISQRHGAETPFLRPAELASDTVPTLPAFQHAVKYFETNMGFRPDIVVIVQPTSPLVRSEDVDGAIEKMVKTKTNSCFTVCEISQRPEWMYYLDNNKPRLFLPNRWENKRSQDLPKLGIINGSVYVVNYETLMKKNKVRDKNTSIYIVPKERSVDIDDLLDFELAEFLMSRQNGKNNKNRK